MGQINFELFRYNFKKKVGRDTSGTIEWRHEDATSVLLVIMRHQSSFSGSVNIDVIFEAQSKQTCTIITKLEKWTASPIAL